MTFNVASGGAITDVNFTISGLSHTYSDDLRFVLVAPNGTNVVLLYNAGGAVNYLNTSVTFDQSAASVLSDTTPGGSTTATNYPNMIIRPTVYGTQTSTGFPFTLTFGNNLDSFNGLSPVGTWSFYAYDDLGSETGGFAGSTLSISGAAAPAAPEPGTWAMMIFGFGAAGSVLRRRRGFGFALAR